MKKILAISGSTRKTSSNIQILLAIKKLFKDDFEMDVYTNIANLPHFNPDLDIDENVPIPVVDFRRLIAEADGVLICTPEYIFSLPGALKNALEWTVSTTLFSDKPVALITASGLGEKAHETLQLIMKTMYANFNNETQLLIQGARTKVNNENFTDAPTQNRVENLIKNFIAQINISPTL